MNGVELILNLLVALTVLGSLMTARITPQIMPAIKAQFGIGAALAVAGFGIAIRSLWIVMAIETHHWQFAAMTLLPWLISLGARAATPPAPRPKGASS